MFPATATQRSPSSPQSRIMGSRIPAYKDEEVNDDENDVCVFGYFKQTAAAYRDSYFTTQILTYTLHNFINIDAPLATARSL
jgi:hypothetical protein